MAKGLGGRASIVLAVLALLLISHVGAQETQAAAPAPAAAITAPDKAPAAVVEKPTVAPAATKAILAGGNQPTPAAATQTAAPAAAKDTASDGAKPAAKPEDATPAQATATDEKKLVAATAAAPPAKAKEADTAAGGDKLAADDIDVDKTEAAAASAAAATPVTGSSSSSTIDAPASAESKASSSSSSAKDVQAPAKSKETTSSSHSGSSGTTDAQAAAERKESSSSSSSSSTAAPAAAQGSNTAPVQVVSLAPGAVPVDDINPDGACKADIESQCDDVEFGNGQVANCLSQVMEEGEAADESQTEVFLLTDDCAEEVMQFKIDRDSNINKNLPLAKACAEDAEKYCKDMQWYNGYRNGSIIACLREIKNKLQPACKEQVWKVQQDASFDYRADNMLFVACEKDAQKLCGDVKKGGGRVQECLRQNRMKLSNWDCEYQLFRKELEDADDLRLSVKMFYACLPDKRQLCADVPAGRAMAKQCLEEHREELSSKCRAEIDTMIERRVRDFRLDTRLKKACAEDIGNICAWGGDFEYMDTFDSMVMNCLQDFRDEIRNGACKAQVHKYVELASQDIRFDVPLADACYEDRMHLCANVEPGSARVIRCLQNQREKLSTVCRATLFNEEARFSENIDFQYPMKMACLKEMERFCKNIPHGNARVIRCLQEKKADKEFGKACRSEVERYEQESAKDYRLNYRLYNACKGDIGQTCKNTCELKEGEICGGKVLACLVENKDKVKAEACQKEVSYLEKMEVNDFRIDMALAEACRNDVATYCAEVQPGEGRVHKCLRDNSAKLSDKCRREEMRIEIKEADSVQLNVGLLRACANERSLFCRGVQPGSARVFRCLAENMASADFGRNCKDQIIKKLQRREANWRLDPPLRLACRADVDRLCASEDQEAKSGSESGIVKKCMVKNYFELSQGCKRELGRSIHMSFFIWRPQGIVTASCDSDIQQLCLSKSQGMDVTPGAVAVCLAEIVEQMDQAAGDALNKRRLLADANQDEKQQGRKEQPGKIDKPAAPAAEVKQVPRLSEECYEIALIAEPPKITHTFDVKSAAYSMLASSMAKIEQTTGLATVEYSKQGGVTGISLTGWTALIGVAALVVVLMAAATIGVRQYLGPRDGYSLVTKHAPVPSS